MASRKKKCPDCHRKGKKPGVCTTCNGKLEVNIVHGRNKGATFERKIAKQVSVWTGVEFKRTPMSGGWNKSGDITPKDPKAMIDFPFSIECKNQECWSVPAFFGCRKWKNAPKAISAWWKQCEDDSVKHKKIPVLVFTQSNQPVFCMLNISDFKKHPFNKNFRMLMRIDDKMVLLWEDFIGWDYESTLVGF